MEDQNIENQLFIIKNKLFLLQRFIKKNIKKCDMLLHSIEKVVPNHEKYDRVLQHSKSSKYSLYSL
jgi:hypothetical protein